MTIRTTCTVLVNQELEMQSVVARIHLNLSAKITGNTNSVQVRRNEEFGEFMGIMIVRH